MSEKGLQLRRKEADARERRRSREKKRRHNEDKKRLVKQSVVRAQM